MKSNISILSIILFPFILHSAIAGDLSNLRGVGMGGTMNAVSRGVDALDVNPANIAIPYHWKF